MVSNCNMVMSQLDFMSRQNLLSLKRDLFLCSATSELLGGDKKLSDKEKLAKEVEFKERQEIASRKR